MALKTFNGKAKASVKTILWKAIAGVKTVIWVSVAPPVYATQNPSDKSANISLSWGNLTATNTMASWWAVRSTIGVYSGKHYREHTIGTWPNWIIWIGNSSASLSNYVGFDANWYSYDWGGAGKINNNVFSSYGATWNTGAVIWVALDMDVGTLTFYKNGVSQWTAFTGLSGTFYAMTSLHKWTGNTVATANFGATTLAYTPPAGFNPWLYT